MILVLAGVVALSGAEAASRVSCGDTITTDATLHHNLVNCPNNGIIIGADNVTLDLNYHTIDGDGIPGRRVRAATTSSVTGGRHIEVTTGSPSSTAPCASSRSAWRRCDSGNATQPRCLISPRRRTTFSGMVIFDSPEAWCKTAPRVRNGVPTEAEGIGMFGSRHIRILHNSIRDNGDIGLYDENLDRSRLIGNTFSAQSRGGSARERRTATWSRHNRFRRDGGGVGVGGNDNVDPSEPRRALAGLGLQVGGGKRNLVARNRVRTHGVSVSTLRATGPSRTPSFARNRVSDAGEDGLAVRSVRKTLKRTQIRRNHVVHSGDDGIDAASASTTLTGNEADRNADLGIEAVRGVTDGGANIARHNGDPRQCTHIACN